MKDRLNGYIGVMDSGVGGISVLKKLTAILPEERFLYYGDSANAPYGEKTPEAVRELTASVAAELIGRGIKAFVIACNTATSAAVSALREAYPEIPIVGMEPAIKPAAVDFPHGRILVLATPATLQLEKFHRLSEQLSDQAEFVSVPCPGLAKRIEKGKLDQPDFMELLHSLLDPYAGSADAVVLGCTHYPFIRKQIAEVLGDLPMYDGAEGTARELRHVLQQGNLLAPAGQEGEVSFVSSLKTEAEIDLYRRFYKMDV